MPSTASPPLRVEAFQALVEALQREVPRIQGVVLADRSGLPIAHASLDGRGPLEVSAIGLLALETARAVGQHLALTAFRDAVLTFAEGCVCVAPLEDLGGALLVLAPPGTDLPHLRSAIGRAVSRIEASLPRATPAT